MKSIKWSITAFLAVLFQVSQPQAFSFRPSSYVYTEVELRDLTRTAQERVKTHPSRIFFPTSFSRIRETTTTSATTILRLPNRFGNVSTTVEPRVENNTQILERTNNATVVPTFEEKSKEERSIVENVTDVKNIVPLCTPEENEDSTQIKSYLTDELIRSKLCSNISILSREYRFDLDRKVCSQAGTQSHCGKNMKFYSFARNSIYGHCDCDYQHSSRIPLVFHGETNRCYFLYQQGFCKPREWIEIGKEGKPVCTENKCYNSERTGFGSPSLASRDIPPEYVPLKGNGPCVKLNQPNEKFCKSKNDVVAFRWPIEYYPSCGEPIPMLPTMPTLPSTVSNGSYIPLPATRFLGEVASLECNPGSYLNAIGSCQPDWDFD